jgi:TolA-binding protein
MYDDWFDLTLTTGVNIMSDNNVNKRLGTTLITIFVIALGLFLVCGVRPPQPSIDDSAIEGSDFSEEPQGDGELESFLDGETDGAANSDGSDNSELSDNLFAEESPASESTEGDMNDILKLLDSENNSESDDDLFAFDDGSGSGEEFSGELASVSDVTSSASSSEEADQFEGAIPDEKYQEMEQEASRLSEVLTDKSEEADSLKDVLETYDEKIAVMELENSGVGQQYQPTYSSAQSSVSEKSAASDSYSSTNPSAASTKAASFASSIEAPKRARVSQPKPAGFNSNYDQALNNFNSGEFTSAVKKFQELLETEPAHKLADDCQYWLGECFMAMRDYTRAIVEYEKVFSYDDHENADAAQFKIGLSFLESGNRKMAKSELDSMLDFYAESELARKARSYLQRL